MTETLPAPTTNSTEQTRPGEFAVAEYVSEALHKHDVSDTDGITRPAYRINGHEIVFRNRQESPLYSDSEVAVPGGSQVYPLERDVWDEDSEAYMLSDESAVRAYVDSHQGSAPRIVVTNTPEGMLAAAALLVESDEERSRLQGLGATFSESQSWNDAQQEVIDTMLAAISVDDNGALKNYLDMDGWPLALAALTGDAKAKHMVETKRQALVAAERLRASNPKLAEQAATHQAESGIEGIEPIPLEQLALVHSTAYDVQRDEDGTVILRTAGQQRDDKYPRASVHFTLNSAVGDVLAGVEKQTWADTNKIIVGNFKQAIDASHTLPNRMAGMDTWFMLNPGETLKLPGALVVEPVEQTASGALIEQTDTGVQYCVKDTYTNEERTLLSGLSRRYGVGGARNIALRIAMERVGVPVELMDSPSGDGHSMNSPVLDGRVRATAIQLGLPSSKHVEAPEARMEIEAYSQLPIMLGKVAAGNLLTEHMYAYPQAAIEARRQALANGFFPARPNVLDESSLEELPGAA